VIECECVEIEVKRDEGIVVLPYIVDYVGSVRGRVEESVYTSLIRSAARATAVCIPLLEGMTAAGPLEMEA